MSVETEITRISGAKTAIATAITNKGVTVPSGTKLDGMASLIDSISGVATVNLQTKSVTYTANGTATITPDDGYDGLSSVDVTVDVASGGGGFNVSISIERAFTGDTLVTGVMEKAHPFKYEQGSLSMQAKMSESGVVFASNIETSSQTYEYIVNLLNVDVYLYTITNGLVKQEITSFPYRFPSGVIAAIYIPVANNAIINTTYYED